jgi:probable rRNA maturation factor
VKHFVTVIVAEPRWKAHAPLAARMKRAAARAVERGARSRRGRALTILLTSDGALKKLNRRFRSRDKATNVLSFPAGPNPEFYLGDVAIALGVTVREAREARRRLSDHATHLAVHGVLHLMGHDHKRAGDARRMERLEAAILAEFGIADPYESPRKPA